jgi:Diol dehydratase reactivase ATPase-like domain/DD-reactivating factor swiveling domain
MHRHATDYDRESLRPDALIAGVDIGNSTTEVAIGRLRGPGLGATPVVADRVATMGIKGGLESVKAAAELVHRLELECGQRVDAVIVAELAPAPVVDASWPRRKPNAGLPVDILDVPDAATCTGVGAFAGCYVRLDELDSASADEPLVIGIDSAWDFADAARELTAAQDREFNIAGVLVEKDEAVLIGNRTRLACPTIDTVPLSNITQGNLVVGESAPRGNGVSRLADPVFLAHSLHLEPGAIPALLPLTRHFASVSAAVLVKAEAEPDDGDHRAIGEIVWEDSQAQQRMLLPASADVLARAVPPGRVTSLTATSGTPLSAALNACSGGVRDIAALDLSISDSVPLALLASAAPLDDVCAAFSEIVMRPVFVGGAEARAGWIGAHSTPGLPREVVVIDIGAGTLDVITSDDSVAVAGAGDLITAGVALSLSISTTLAENAKMHPVVRVETPHLIAREDGVREFPHGPVPGSSVGRLSLVTVHGDLVPLGSRLAPETWHRERLGIKATVLERGLLRARRVLRGGFADDALLLLAGGGAEDAELVTAAARFAHLGQVAIADVAGQFGPRCAVAWGLVLGAGEG